MQPAAREGSHRTAPTVSRMGAPIQNPECPELIGVSPPGAYDGREKWAAADVFGGSEGPDSVMTPSWGDEAQAESSHAITKASIPHSAALLFTKPNLLIAELDATSGIERCCQKKDLQKILRRNRSSRLVLHGRQLGRA
jgi:hypothetical protein